MTGIEPSFNLIDSPWIPVLDRQGRLEDVSLLDCLARGDEFIQIVGEVPTQVFAIQRLVLAVLHRAVQGPEDMAEWQEMRADWPAVVDAVGEYLSSFRERFYLLHPTSPFYQVADLRSAKNETSGLEKLIIDVPNGAPFFTTRIGSGLNRISFPEAARWLVHVHAFDPSGIKTGAVGDPRVKGGRGYPIGTGWAGRLGGVSAIGATLSETWQLNLIAPALVAITSGPNDRPPWERPQLTEKVEVGGTRPEPAGMVDLYTWQSRRIRLVADTEGVTGVVLAQGDPMSPHNRHDTEPMTAWRYSDPQTKKFGRDVYMPNEHDPERSMWRGLAALLPYAEAETTSKGVPRRLPPALVRWLSEVRDADAVDGQRVVRLRATGMTYGPQSATAEAMVDDMLALPMSLLGQDAAELETVVADQVRCTERTAFAVASLAGNLAQAAGGSPDDRGPGNRAREQFYAAVDTPFREWLEHLTLTEPVLDAAARWQRQARYHAEAVGADLVAAAGPAAWIGRTVRDRHIDAGKADVWFRPALKKELPKAYALEQETEGAA